MCFRHQRYESEPYIETNMWNMWSEVWHAPCIISKRFLPVRIFILLVQMAESIMNALSYAGVKVPGNYRSYWYIKNFSKYANLHLLPVHNYIACVIGLDKMFAAHLCLFPIKWISEMIADFPKIIPGMTDRTLFTHFKQDAGHSRILFFLIFNMKTRLLYIKMYREATAPENRPKDIIFNFLLCPWIILATIQIAACAILVYFKEAVSYLNDSFDFVFMASLLYFELYMYLVLNPKKSHVLHGLKNLNGFERFYLSMPCIYLIMATTYGIFHYVDRSFNMDTESMQLTDSCFGLIGSIVYGVRWWILWNVALIAWNMNDLSQNSFEKMLENLYDSNSTTDGVIDQFSSDGVFINHIQDEIDDIHEFAPPEYNNGEKIVNVIRET